MEAPEARADLERVAEPVVEVQKARGKLAAEPAARTEAPATVGHERPGVTAAEASADPAPANYAQPVELIVQAEQVERAERIVRRTNEAVPVAGMKAVPAPAYSLPVQERIEQSGRAGLAGNGAAHVGEWKVCLAPRVRPEIEMVVAPERLQTRAEVGPARNFLHQKRNPQEYQGLCLRLLHNSCRSAGLPGERPRTGDRYG